MSELKLVIPLDGSKLAESSLAYVAALKRLGEVHVLLVSAVDVPDDLPFIAHDEAVDRNDNILGTYLREVAADLKTHLSVEVTTQLVHGNPAAEILAAVGEFGADLLVVSTHGRSGIARWRLGSVADKLIRGATCDTLVIGPRPAAEQTWFAELMPPFKSVLVPLDGSALAEQALPTALRLVSAYGAELHLVRVANYPIVGEEGVGIAWDVVAKACDAYLAKKASDLLPVQSKTARLIGGAADEIITYAATQGIALTVVTSRGRGGFARATLGSVTDRLLGGPTPVLIVHPAP